MVLARQASRPAERRSAGFRFGELGMADLSDPLPGSGLSTWSVVGALAGSLLSLRMLVDSNPWARAGSVVGSFTVALFVVPVLLERYALSEFETRLASLLVAFLGMSLLAGVWTFGEKWRRDGAADAIAWLLSLIGRRSA
jgi:hypothetical protein